MYIASSFRPKLRLTKLSMKDFHEKGFLHANKFPVILNIQSQYTATYASHRVMLKNFFIAKFWMNAYSDEVLQGPGFQLNAQLLC